jgi:hypothetical protein
VTELGRKNVTIDGNEAAAYVAYKTNEARLSMCCSSTRAHPMIG